MSGILFVRSPSIEIFGIQFNHLGKYQAFEPNNFIILGTNIERTTVASINTAAPNPNPIDWKNAISQVQIRQTLLP